MRLLLVTGTGVDPHHGGQGSFCRYLAEGLVELGHAVEMAGGQGWAGFCGEWGIPLRDGQGAPSKKVDLIHVNGPGIRRAVLGLTSRHKVVLTHQDHRYVCPATTAWTPKGCAGSGSCGPCRHCPTRDPWSRARLAVLRFVAASCCNVAVSSYLLRRLVLPNGHAILSPIRRQPTSAPQDPNLVAFAGRIVPEKGLEVLLRAVSKVGDIRLEIAGDGPILPTLRRVARDLGIARRVRFLGPQSLDGVQNLYRRAAIVCVPSIWHEPYGYAAAEALALGRTLVASDRGALPELAGCERGWVCRADDPDDWAKTLKKALEDGEERERRCCAGARFVSEELSPRRVAERYSALYERCLGGASAKVER